MILPPSRSLTWRLAKGSIILLLNAFSDIQLSVLMDTMAPWSGLSMAVIVAKKKPQRCRQGQRGERGALLEEVVGLAGHQQIGAGSCRHIDSIIRENLSIFSLPMEPGYLGPRQDRLGLGDV